MRAHSLTALSLTPLLLLALAACKDDTPVDDTVTDDTAADDTATDDTEEPEGEPLDLVILHVNDHHSHLGAETRAVDVSAMGLAATADSNGTPVSSVTMSWGGYPMLVPLFDTLEGSADNVLRLHAGDAVSGTLFYTLYAGEADAAMMNRVCYDAFALGNHEFDNGDAGLASFLDFLAAGSCGTEVLSANLSPATSSPLASGYVVPETVFEVRGQRVAVIGLTIAQKTMESSRPDEGTTLDDEATTAQARIDALRADGVDKIVLLTHYTYEGDMALAARVSGVDVIVGGDSHSLLGGANLTAMGLNVEGPYPTQVTNADGEPVCIAQAWEYSHLLGQLEVSFDAEGVVTSCGGSPRIPYHAGTFTYGYTDANGQSSTRTLESADAALVTTALGAIPELVPVTPDAATATALDTYAGGVEELRQQVIGVVDEDLCLERFPGQGRSTICDRSATYAQGSQVADAVARAFLEVTPTADIAVQNAGGVRVDIASGDFTIADGFTVLPFSNTLVTMELSGAELVQVLEDALSNALDEGGSTGSYPYAAGMRYHVDASATAGHRVTGVQVNPRFAGTWTDINLSATYTVVTNNFIGSGQDGYDAFGVAWGEGRYLDTYVEYAQGLIDYMEVLTAAGEGLTRRTTDEASTRSYTGRDGCNHSQRSDCSSY